MSKTLPIIITFVIAGAGGFFGGMQYQKSKGGPASLSLSGQAGDRQMVFGNFADMTPEQRQQMRTQFGGGGGRGGVRFAGGDGGTAGEIIAKDEQSITLKLPDGGPASSNGSQGGSKIVFYSTSTEVRKSTQGTREDLAVGENVFVTGTTNDDGSFTAQAIQLRPAIPPAAPQGR